MALSSSQEVFIKTSSASEPIGVGNLTKEDGASTMREVGDDSVVASVPDWLWIHNFDVEGIDGEINASVSESVLSESESRGYDVGGGGKDDRILLFGIVELMYREIRRGC